MNHINRIKITRREQAGLVIDAGPGRRLAIDLGIATPADALDEIQVDAILFSHTHPDHFHREHALALEVPVFGPADVIEALLNTSVVTTELKANESTDVHGMSIKPFDVDHGPSIRTPCVNFGFVIRIDDTVIVHAGDMKIPVAELPVGDIDVLVLPVGDNGGVVFTAEEAADFVRQIRHRGLTLPGHTEAPNTGPMAVDPDGGRRFVELASELCDARLLAVGEAVQI